MSATIPFRAPRIRPQILRRQCLFQRLPPSPLERSFSTTTSRAGYRKTGRVSDSALTRAMAQQQTGPAPRVNLQLAQQNIDAMQEDIGILQGTVVRAPFAKIGNPWNMQFWSYLWTLLKSKGTGWYSRSFYRGCVQKSGWTKALPVDLGNNAVLKERARKMYVQVYDNLASGNLSPLKTICLPPLTKQIENRIAARGDLKMHWKLVSWKSARVVSHRASAQDADVFPDTAYRQAIVRLESIQTLTLEAPETPELSSSPSPRSKRNRRWTPAEVLQEEQQPLKTVEATETPVPVNEAPEQRVVEYLVMQRRVVRGVQEEWKVWGFADESTPATLKQDDKYWAKTLNANLAASSNA